MLGFLLVPCQIELIFNYNYKHYAGVRQRATISRAVILKTNSKTL